MTFQTPSGFTQIDTDSGTATITAAKPNMSIVGTGGTTTSATGNVINVSSQDPAVSEAENLGIDYNSGTGVFTLLSSDKTNLSASNPGFIRFQNESDPGANFNVKVEQNYRFIDSNGTSQIANNLFGIGSGIWDSNMPMFIYAIYNASLDDLAIGISRIPKRLNSTLNLGSIGNASINSSNDDSSIFLLQKSDGMGGWIDQTPGDFLNKPAQKIGAFVIRKTTSTDWTVQNLTFDTAGIGLSLDDRTFAFPSGLFGATSGSYLRVASGTPPTWSLLSSSYRFYKGNKISVRYNANNQTIGSGGAQMWLTIPFRAPGAPNNESGEILGNGYGSFPRKFLTLNNAEAVSGEHHLANIFALISGSSTILLSNTNNTFVTDVNAGVGIQLDYWLSDV